MKYFPPLLIIGVVVVGGFFIIGWFGLRTSTSVKVALCVESYDHYVVQPFIRNWYECRNQIPCGTAEELDASNAGIRVVQCLCGKNPPSAALIASTVTQYVDHPIYVRNSQTAIPATDTTGICTNISESFRL